MSFKGDPVRAEPLLSQALTLYMSLANDTGTAEILNALGRVRAAMGQLSQAVVYQQASLQQARRIGCAIRTAWALAGLGRASMFRGEHDLAVTHLEEALAIDVLHGEAQHVVLVMLAEALSQRGDDAHAVGVLEGILPGLRAEAGVLFICEALILRARLAREHGEDAAAEPLLWESLARAYDGGAATQLAHTHYELGRLFLARSEPPNAQHHFQECLALFRAQQHPWLVANALLGAGATALALGEHGAARAHYRACLGLLADWRENVPAQHAGLIAGLAGLVATAPHDAPALRQTIEICGAIAKVKPHAFSRGATPPFLHILCPDRARREAVVVMGRATLGDAIFNTAWSRGHTQVLEQTVANALTACYAD